MDLQVCSLNLRGTPFESVRRRREIDKTFGLMLISRLASSARTYSN